jgi:hypothetical protein
VKRVFAIAVVCVAALAEIDPETNEVVARFDDMWEDVLRMELPQP